LAARSRARSTRSTRASSRCPGTAGSGSGGQADFFLFFVFLSVVAGTLLLVLKPLLDRLLAGRQ